MLADKITKTTVSSCMTSQILASHGTVWRAVHRQKMSVTYRNPRSDAGNMACVWEASQRPGVSANQAGQVQAALLLQSLRHSNLKVMSNMHSPLNQTDFLHKYNCGFEQERNMVNCFESVINTIESMEF